ncbi:MAG: YqeG family HAD IIIA-type phosphatase [Firmicutes bacterium]|nr:YqeG family HAD IIIA-type phosphatase [Bacillota bacterium]
MSLLKPKMQVRRIYDIDLKALKDLGVLGLVFDLDNTVTPWHEYAENKEVVTWFDELAAAGLKACILSNTAKARVMELCPWLNVPVIGGAAKPGRRGFQLASELLQLPPARLAMVGDQILTDMLGANRAGFYTILTQPLTEREFWGTKNINRRLERLIKRFW